MFDLGVLISRYVFIFYMMYFLWLAFLYLWDERGVQSESRALYSTKQRLTILFMHGTAFAILAYIPQTFTFDRNSLLIGAGGLAFFILAWLTLPIFYKGSCPLLWNCMFFLMDVGLIALVRVQRISRLKDSNISGRQLIWFFVGMLGLLLVALVFKIISKLEKLGLVYVLVSYLLLLSPFVIGREQGGAVNWIQFRGISFQPSEIVKFLYVFYLSAAFGKKSARRQLVLPSMLSAGMVLILTLQTDLGGAFIFFMSFMIMLYISTGSNLLFALGIGAASAAAAAAHQLFSHVRVRVAAWQNPWQDIDRGGYQIIQSLFAIGTWGLTGSGLTQGSPGLVPVVESDFIFAAICEEFGGLFGIGLIGVFFIMFYRGIHISLRAGRRFYALLAAGFTSILAFQTFLILGGVIKLIPLTGVTLPFVSYGGSSVVVSILMVGILQQVYVY